MIFCQINDILVYRINSVIIQPLLHLVTLNSQFVNLSVSCVYCILD